MSQNIVELVIKGDDQSAKAIASAIGNMKGLDSALGSIADKLSGIVSAGAMLALAKSALELGDNLAKASAKFGISVEDMSALRYAAIMADVPLEDLQTGIKKLSQAIVGGVDPTKELGVAFTAMGISIKDVNGNVKPTQDLMVEIAQKFETYRDGAEKTALAVALFGRSGVNMIPVMKDMAKGFSEMQTEAAKFGALMTTAQAKQLEEYNDNLKKLKETLIGLAGATVTAAIGMAKLAVSKELFTGGYKAPQSTVQGKLSDIMGPNPDPAKTNAPNPAAILAAQEAAKKAAEAARKAAEERKKEDEALMAAGEKSWVAHADTVIKIDEELQKTLSDITKKGFEDEDKETADWQKKDLDGWSAYAEAIVQENESTASGIADAMRHAARESEGLMDSMRKLSDDFAYSISDAFAELVVRGKAD